MTLSAFLLSVLSGNTPHAQVADRGSDDMHIQRTRPLTPEEEDLQRCKTYRKSFPMTEIALPATALRNRSIAKWVRDHRVTVDVRSGEELATAIAAGVHLQRLTLYADALSESELRAAVNLGVGRVVAGSVQQIELLRSVVAKRAQDVVIRMTDLNTPVLAIAGAGDGRLDSGSTATNPTLRSRRFSTTSGSTSSGCIARSARKTTTSSAIRPRSVT